MKRVAFRPALGLFRMYDFVRQSTAIIIRCAAQWRQPAIPNEPAGAICHSGRSFWFRSRESSA